ncbi:MAG: PDDEXK nuclease domain-containing protein [Bacteroidales bacterium]|jgi:hypothetical protein|nr:PDDEXK nuclease domain-containing protein [Smithellaceae bacterium]MDD3848888.1 PDDEXK nuclease domain-containing protein [Smithellaceae bacterium]
MNVSRPDGCLRNSGSWNKKRKNCWRVWQDDQSQRAFPGTFGFSPQNVWRMLQFFRTYTDSLFLSQAVRELEKKGRKTPNPEELGDKPSIGIILCAEKDDVEVEYALKTKQNPIGVAEYHLQSKLPAEMKGKLPTARQLADVVRATLPEKKEKRP